MESREINTRPTFVDGDKREWSIKLTLDAMDRIVEATGIDLIPDDLDVQPVMGLLFKSRTLGLVLWTAISRQAEAQEVTKEMFFESCDTDALTSGWGALVDAVVFFIHQKNETLGKATADMVEAQMLQIEAGANQIHQTIHSDEARLALQESATSLGELMKSELKKIGKTTARPRVSAS